MLKIAKLSAGYAGMPIIHDIDLNVQPGEIVALIGANGAGKSTLSRAISGLLPALSGQIHFAGRDVTGLSPRGRVQAGLLHAPEGRQVFATLTVEQNLELGAYSLSTTTGEYKALLESVYVRFPVLRERARSYAGNLSGGQQQMLAIARALMGKPRLLILDEPSLGLSPLLVREIFHLVAGLRTQGLGILLSEQNAKMSLRIADRGVIMENGRIVMAGPSAELLASPEVAMRYLGAERTSGDGGDPGLLSDRLLNILQLTGDR
jgi:branched-chain amino acid transport system ATP-binding protein